MTKSNIEYLKNLPPFKNLTDETLSSLSENLKIVNYPKGTIIFHAGDKGDSFYVIKEGTVNVFITAPDSEEKVILSNLNESDYFGEMALLTGEPRSASVESATDVSLIRLEKKAFEELLEKDPKISISISHMISQRLMKANLDRAASEQFYRSKISPSGSFTVFPVMEVLKFCEENSLTGQLVLEHKEKTAVIAFLKGNVQKIDLDDLNEAEAMDTLIQWQEGKFKIEPSFFSLVDHPEPKKSKEKSEEHGVGKEKIKSESKNENLKIEIPDLLQDFLRSTFLRLVDLVGSHQLKEITEEVHSKCKPFFSSLESFTFKVVPEIKIDLKKYKYPWTEKDTLGVAVFLETIIKSCQHQVYGMSYLNLEDLAGKDGKQLKEISFFDYMSNAEEFKL
jgi:CRP-like cAMP-binding protein